MEKKYKLIIFDFDFTLADSSEGIVQCVNYALNKMGFAYKEPELIKKCIGMTLTNTYNLLTNEANDNNARKFHDFFVELADEIMVNSTIFYPDVFEVLPELKKKNIYWQLFQRNTDIELR